MNWFKPSLETEDPDLLDYKKDDMGYKSFASYKVLKSRIASYLNPSSNYELEQICMDQQTTIELLSKRVAGLERAVKALSNRKLPPHKEE